MARKFLHIGFVFTGPPRVKDLEPVFDASGDDWMRYSASNWIVWTERSAAQWYSIISPHIALSEQVLIIGVDMNERYGWLTRSLWDWMDVRRGTSRVLLGEILAQLPSPPPKP